MAAPILLSGPKGLEMSDDAFSYHLSKPHRNGIPYQSPKRLSAYGITWAHELIAFRKTL
jgi:hypothetical protein